MIDLLKGLSLIAIGIGAFEPIKYAVKTLVSGEKQIIKSSTANFSYVAAAVGYVIMAIISLTN